MSAKQNNTSFPYRDNKLAGIRRAGNIHSYAVIKDIMGSQMIDSLPLRIRCECSILDCQEIVGLSLSRRRELRQKYPKGFIVILSHAYSPPNTKVYESQEFSVVERLEFNKAVVDI